MSVTTRVGTAVAAGYVLGRFKKLRLALIVGSALSNSAVRARGLELLKSGTQSLNRSPEVQKLGQQVSEQLVQAGRAAAVAAATGKIDKISDRLHERTAHWDMPSTSDKDAPKDAEDDVDEDTGEVREEQPPEDEVDEAESDQDGEPADEFEEEPKDEFEEEPEGEPEDEPEEPEDELEEDVDAEPEDEPADDEQDEKATPRHARSSRRGRAGAPTEGA